MITEDHTLQIMSFNIRCDTGKNHSGDPDYWPEREPLVRQLLTEAQPDILGVQELMTCQIPAVQQGLSSRYAYIGQSRDNTNKGEMSAIFYNTERLVPRYWNQLWLSDTPRVPASITWGNDCTRIVTWGTFLDKKTGREMTVSNTHFDHISEYSRIRSAEMLVSLFGGCDPVVLMGDFNADADPHNKEYDVLTSVFRDSSAVTEHHSTPDWGTFSDYHEPSMDDPRIDWILSSQDVAVRDTKTYTFNVDGHYPSDHLPISARVELVR